mgnify:CR=1 FL=1
MVAPALQSAVVLPAGTLRAHLPPTLLAAPNHCPAQLSASQRRLRLCGGADGGPPSAVCQLVRAFVCPQLPAALAPPALLAAGSALLYAAAWLLYSTAPLTIPLALWLAFAANGQLGLAPQAAALAARLHPAAGAAAAQLADVALPAALRGAAQRPAAALALLAGLLLLLRLAERAVLRRRQRRWETASRRLTAADVEARYSGWAPPSSASPASPDAVVLAAEQPPQAQRKAGSPVPSPPLLLVLREQVGALWHAVYGAAALPTDPLESYEGEGGRDAGRC